MAGIAHGRCSVYFGHCLGCRWADTPSPVGTPCPTGTVSEDGSSGLPELLLACVVTHAMSKSEPVAPDGRCSDVDLEVPSLFDFLLLVSPDELLHEQQ